MLAACDNDRLAAYALRSTAHSQDYEKAFHERFLLQNLHLELMNIGNIIRATPRTCNIVFHQTTCLCDSDVWSLGCTFATGLCLGCSKSGGMTAGYSEDVVAKLDQALTMMKSLRKEGRTASKLAASMAHLVLLGQLRPVSSQSSKQNAHYRQSAINHYYGGQALADEELYCMLEGRDFPADKIIAAHIYRWQWNPSFLVMNLLPDLFCISVPVSCSSDCAISLGS